MKFLIKNEQLVCTGETIQVFVDNIGEGELSLTIPEFFYGLETKSWIDK